MKGNERRIWKGVFFLLLVLGQPNSFAATIKGVVLNSVSDEGLSGANVFVEEKREIGSAANIDGYYQINNLPVGNWTISASAMGYGKVSHEINISEEEGEYSLDFALYPKVLRGNEVVVTATREPRVVKDLPIRTEIITREDILQKGAFDLYQALEGQPGIRVETQCSNCNFTMVRSQGLEGGYAEILLDGQPVFTGLAGVYGLQQIMASNIEEIEIIKGAGSSLYGAGALSGVLNIKTKEPDIVPRMNLGLYVGDHELYSMNFNGTMKKDRLSVVYAFQFDTKGEIDQTGNIDSGFIENGNYEDAGSDGFTDRVFSENYGAILKLFVDEPFGKGSKLLFSGSALGEFRKGGFIESFEDPFDIDAEHVRTQRQSFRTSYFQNIGDRNRLEINLSYVNHYRNATNGAAWEKAVEAGVLDENLDMTPAGSESLQALGFIEFQSRYFPKPFIADEDIYLADFMYSHPLMTKGDVKVGAQYRRSEIEQDINGQSDEDKKFADDIGLFLQFEMMPFTDDLEIILGARLDNHYSEDGLTSIEYSKTAVNPRFAARYSLNRNVTLRGSYGSGFRVPYLFAEDLHLCASSPRIYKGDDLEPEKASSFALGVDFAVSANEMGAGMFYTLIDNKIEFIEPGGEREVPAGYDFRWTNVGEAKSIGAEVYLRGNPLKWLSYNANAVFTKARFDEKRDPDLTESDIIPRSPEITAFGEIIFSYSKININTSLNYTGSMFIDHVPNGNEEEYILEKTEPFVTIDAGVDYRVNRAVKIVVRFRNLLDYTQPTRDITDPAYIYAPIYGREISAGVNISL